MSKARSSLLCATFVCALILPPRVASAESVRVCEQPGTGFVRLLGPNQQCKPAERAHEWNVAGSESVATFLENGGPEILVPNAQWITVARMELPAGSYVANVSLLFTNVGTTPGLGYCMLAADTYSGNHAVRNSQAADTVPSYVDGSTYSAVSQALTLADTFPEPGFVFLMCTNNTLQGGDLHIQSFNLNVTAVGTVSFQP